MAHRNFTFKVNLELGEAETLQVERGLERGQELSVLHEMFRDTLDDRLNNPGYAGATLTVEVVPDGS